MVLKRAYVHAVGVLQTFFGLRVENYLYRKGRKAFLQYLVCHVAAACLGKRPVERNFKSVRLRKKSLQEVCRAFRAHAVRAGRSFSYSV